MLTSLRVEAFENHTATDIDLSRVNWFTGGNGQGKSAIANALEYLLTGGTDLVPNGGAGMLAYIQDGKPRASVQAQVGADLITRELPAKAGEELTAKRGRLFRRATALRGRGWLRIAVSGPS